MVIGNGLIASVFKDDYLRDDRYVIFASGVSNSLETDDFEYSKEEDLLRKTLKDNKDKHFVYFTSFMYANKRKYANHKGYMESIIINSGVDFTILRLPQVIGRGGNMHNLFNYLVFSIRNNIIVNLYSNVFRSLIDVDDVKRIVDESLKLPNEWITFSYIEKLMVMDIVNIIAKELNVKPRINLVESEYFNFPERTLQSEYIMQQLGIKQERYTERIINKYLG